MTKIIIIRNLRDIEVGARTLNRIRKRLPQLTSDTMMQWGRMLEQSMKNSAKQAGIKNYTGLLQGKGIEWRQRPRGKTGRLFMRLQGVYLDSMKPHYVSVIRRRTKLLSWALQANNAMIRHRAKLVNSRKKRSFPLYVTPKPFIRRGYMRARRRLKPMLKRSTRLAVMTA